jgi:zinc protease
MKRKLLISIFLTCLICVAYGKNTGKKTTESETAPKIEKLIIDPKVRYGKLANGMTYYIRHNELPKERAEFYIVQNVGSLQEKENQRGLAHFLEHMAFNGSKHFPALTGIADYCQSIGMESGTNMNAYTGFDQTVYMLMGVPVARQGVIDSCLLILHDWSSSLLLTDEAIEKERGIVREEWRTRSSAQNRLWEQQLPVMYPGCKYGTRLPIGSIDIINNFKGEELRAYYKEWYRPDLQALVIVGDIDVDKVEAKIKSLCADIKMPDNFTPREEIIVPDNSRPIVSIAKDKEMTNTTLAVFYKHEKLPEVLKGTIADFLTGYSQSVIMLVMSERFSDILTKSNPPFARASADDGDYFVALTKGAWTSAAVVKPEELKRGMDALVRETEKIKKFGITDAEYERAQANILKAMESAYNEREKQQNSAYASQYVNHFVQGGCIPGIETEYKIIKELAPNLPVGGINSYITNLFKSEGVGKNVVISLTGPDIAEIKYPAEDELLKMFGEAIEQSVTANGEENINAELISELPKPGKIVEEKLDPKFGATLFTLSNGVRVVVKPTELKKDEIILTAASPGGTSLFKDDKDIWNLKVINSAIRLGGLGNLNATDLGKVLAGKQLSLLLALGEESEYVKGETSPSDLKTFFELIYLSFTGVRTDDEAYSSMEERARAQLKNAALDPIISFGDMQSSVLYNGNPRNRRIKSSDFDKIDYHRMIEMYKERYKDASDFTFTFVGNIDLDSIRPYLEQYLATLPSIYRKEKADVNMVTPFQKGKLERHFTRKLETPKSTVGLIYSGEMPYNLKNVIITQLLNKILNLVYTEKVREGEGATYGVQSAVQLLLFPEGRTTIQIIFDTDPERQDEILNIVKTELHRIAEEGPTEGNLTKSRGNLTKTREEAMQENGFWLDILDAYYNRNIDSQTDYDRTLLNITVDDIKDFTKRFLDQGNEVEVVMSPE